MMVINELSVCHLADRQTETASAIPECESVERRYSSEEGG